MFGRDVVPFLRAWAANPLRIAAIAPSGEALAMAITSEITAQSAPIVELGPGTGVFTRALLARGVPESELILIEFENDFARILERRFPEAEIHRGDAARIADMVHARGPIGAVVSGLPILSMPPKKVISILDGAFRSMRPGGAFYQFTYAPRCPVARPILDRLGLKATRIGRALMNMPPAAVYRISRRGSRPAMG